jgi:hypothetical protein
MIVHKKQKDGGCYETSESGFFYHSLPSKNVIFKNFNGRPLTRPTATRDKVQSNKSIKIRSFQDCYDCKSRIFNGLQSIRRSHEITINKMITSEAALLEKISKLEALLEKNKEISSEAKKAIDFYRVLGFGSISDTSETGIELFIAQHKLTWKNLPLESQIRIIDAIQKLQEFFTLNLRETSSKTDINLRIKEMRVEESFAAKRQIRMESPECKKFDKLLTDMAKSQRVTKKDALKSLELMGMKAPEGFEL